MKASIHCPGKRQILFIFLNSVILFIQIFLPPVCCETPDERQKRLIEEFTQEQQRKTELRDTVRGKEEVQSKYTGHATLREKMKKARLDFALDKTTTNRQAVIQSTQAYVEAVSRVGQMEEAIQSTLASLRVISKDPILSKTLAELRMKEYKVQMEAGDWNKARITLETCLNEGHQFQDMETVQNTREVLSDFRMQKALAHYRRGEWKEAEKEAWDAQITRRNPESVHLLLGRIHYQMDEYEEAERWLKSAIQRDHEGIEYARWLMELNRKERLLESNARRYEKDDFVVTYSPNQVIDSRALMKSLLTAKEEIQGILGIQISHPIRVSVYQRSDFSRFLEAPAWAVISSLESKLRIRVDGVQGQNNDQLVMAKYAIGLWLADFWTEGKAPAWFQEGLAHFLAYPSGPPNGALAELRKRWNRNLILPFTSLETSFFGILDELDAAVCLAQSQFLVRLIIDKEGIQVIQKYMEDCREMSSPQAALLENTDFDYDSLMTFWGKELTEKFITNPDPNRTTLKSLGRVSPLGSMWEQ